MINSLDILSNFESSMSERMEEISVVLDSTSKLIDMSVDVLDLVKDTSIELTPPDVDILNSVLRDIAGRTYTLADGVIMSLAIEADEQGTTLINRTTNSIALMIERGKLLFYGLTPSGFSFGDFIEQLANTFTQSTIVQRAIRLAEKGELTASNFMTNVSDISANANATISSMISQIADSIMGVSPASQATALLTSLRTMWSGIKNAHVNADDTAIEFNDNDYTVSTSILFPTNVIVNAASAVLASFISFINPIFGTVIGLVGSAIGKAVSIINDNSSTEYKFADLEERDNDCFATPLIQRSCSLSAFPAAYQTLLNKVGYVKLINGLLTAYIWRIDDVTVNVEVFGCAECDLSYNNADSDLLEKQVFSAATGNSKSITIAVPTSVSYLKTNVSRWLDSTTTPGGQAVTCERLVSKYDRQSAYNKLSARYISTVALFVLIQWTLAGKNGKVFTDVDELEWLSSGTVSDPERLQVSFMNALYQYGSTKLNNPYDHDLKNFLASLVNKVIPSVRASYNRLSDEQFVNFFSVFPTPENTSEASLAGTGQGSNFYISYSIANKANAYVYPPQSTVSIWARAAVSLIIIVATATTTAIAATKIKRKIQYKAFMKRAELKKLNEQVAASGSYDDWLKATKAAKKYNKFLGRLSGTQYDLNNQWVEYSATQAVDSGLLASLVNRSGDKAELSVADYTVRNLIRPSK